MCHFCSDAAASLVVRVYASYTVRQPRKNTPPAPDWTSSTGVPPLWDLKTHQHGISFGNRNQLSVSEDVLGEN